MELKPVVQQVGRIHLSSGGTSPVYLSVFSDESYYGLNEDQELTELKDLGPGLITLEDIN